LHRFFLLFLQSKKWVPQRFFCSALRLGIALRLLFCFAKKAVLGRSPRQKMGYALCKAVRNGDANPGK
jgi:hypothetical protein